MRIVKFLNIRKSGIQGSGIRDSGNFLLRQALYEKRGTCPRYLPNRFHGMKFLGGWAKGRQSPPFSQSCHQPTPEQKNNCSHALPCERAHNQGQGLPNGTAPRPWGNADERHSPQDAPTRKALFPGWFQAVYNDRHCPHPYHHK